MKRPCFLLEISVFQADEWGCLGMVVNEFFRRIFKWFDFILVITLEDELKQLMHHLHDPR